MPSRVPPPLPSRLPSEVRAALVAVLIARTGVNAGMRIVYPFLPAIARGLGTSLAVLGVLLALRSLAGVVSPVVARLAETHGRRDLMVVASLAVVAGCLVTAGAPGVVVAGIGFIIVGVAKPAFDVPMQAWFGDRVPYARRGRVLGVTELTWSFALLVTVPLSGVLIAATDWRAPFVLVAALCLVGAVAVRALIGADRPHRPEPRPLRLDAPRVTMLAVTLLFTVAAELLFVVYGAWLEDDVGLTVTGIGVFTVVVALAELTGEGLVTTVSDHWGLRRSIAAGLAVSALGYLAFGVVGASLALAIVVVVVWLIGFEVTIVAAIPFVSELAVEARDRLLSLMVLVIAIGRAIGGVAAPPLYALGGITASGVAAAVCAVVAGLLILRVPSPAGR